MSSTIIKHNIAYETNVVKKKNELQANMVILQSLGL